MSAPAIAVPPWERVTVPIACESGMVDTPGIVHPWCPGLAVTMGEFGTFGVTHLPSGRRIGAKTERATTAVLEMAEWAAIARLCGGSFAAVAVGSVSAMFKPGLDKPVPFARCTTTSGGVTRPMTVREWLQVAHDPFRCEFPWEDHDPRDVADEILATLAPSVAEGADA